MALTKMHWILGQKWELSTSNKIILYKAILKPVWTYGTQPWVTASTSNIEILERFQSVFAHDCRFTLEHAEYSYPKGSTNTKIWRRNPSLQLSI
jgi:hypothetical protein